MTDFTARVRFILRQISSAGVCGCARVWWYASPGKSWHMDWLLNIKLYVTHLRSRLKFQGFRLTNINLEDSASYPKCQRLRLCEEIHFRGRSFYQLKLQVDRIDKKFGINYHRLFFLNDTTNLIFNPCRPKPGRRKKIKLNFYFHASLWCLTRFYEGLKGLHKTYWGTTKKC